MTQLSGNSLVLTNPDTSHQWWVYPTDQEFEGAPDDLLYIGPAETDPQTSEVSAKDGPRLSFETEYVNGSTRLAEFNFDFIYSGNGYRAFGLAHDLDTHRSFFGGSGTFSVSDTTGAQLRFKINDEPYDEVNQSWPDVAASLHNIVWSWDTSRNATMMRRLDSHGGYAEFLRLTPKTGAGETHDLWRLCAVGPGGVGNPLQCEAPFTCTKAFEVKDGTETVFRADADGIQLGDDVPNIADCNALLQWLDGLNVINYTGP